MPFVRSITQDKRPTIRPKNTGRSKKTNIKTNINKIVSNTMKKDKKKQDDRLLKQLNFQERKRQEVLRSLILNDPAFQVA